MVQTSETGEGIFDKLKGSMDKARMMGSRVVPNFGQNNPRHAQVTCGSLPVVAPRSSVLAINLSILFTFRVYLVATVSACWLRTTRLGHT